MEVIDLYNAVLLLQSAYRHAAIKSSFHSDFTPAARQITLE